MYRIVFTIMGTLLLLKFCTLGFHGYQSKTLIIDIEFIAMCRDAKALQEKAAKKAAQAGGGGSGSAAGGDQSKKKQESTSL